jgi:hypothetical protein
MKTTKKQLSLFELEPRKRKERKIRAKPLVINENGEIIGVSRDDCTEALEAMEKELAEQGIKIGRDEKEELMSELNQIALDDIKSAGGQMTERARKIFVFLEDA